MSGGGDVGIAAGVAARVAAMTAAANSWVQRRLDVQTGEHGLIDRLQTEVARQDAAAARLAARVDELEAAKHDCEARLRVIREELAGLIEERRR